jgi:hypothetical protein
LSKFAAVKMVHHFMQKSKVSTFSDFIEEFPRLKYAFRDLLSMHYGFDVIHNDEAKRIYLEPDLLPFS